MASQTLDPGIELDVMIIGAGLSGIGAAWHLQDKCPGRSFGILEARSDLGGTWDLFRYPGIRSDSDMYTFGYNFRPWMDGKVFADGPSIRNYVRDTAREADIESRIQFDTRVTAVRWDTASARWSIEATGPDGVQTWTARFVILCSGYYRYSEGYMPDFPGRARFTGDVIHPQLWDESYDYSGKKTVIIGSGATAVTLVPAMADKAAHVTMLQRSPSYIAARPSRDGIADFLRKILPSRLAYTLTRIKNVAQGMFFFNLARRAPNMARKSILKDIRTALGEDFDVETHFSPPYNPWDQRFCMAPDGDFFEVLKSGQATIETDHIETFTETGIQLKSGKHLEADLIIPATGLSMQIGGGMEIEVDGPRPRTRPRDLSRHDAVPHPQSGAVLWLYQCQLDAEDRSDLRARVPHAQSHGAHRGRLCLAGAACRPGNPTADRFLIGLCETRGARPATPGHGGSVAHLSELRHGHDHHPLWQAGCRPSQIWHRRGPGGEHTRQRAGSSSGGVIGLSQNRQSCVEAIWLECFEIEATRTP